MRVKTRLRFLREAHHLTQKELAEKLFLSQRAYASYETGANTLPLYRVFDLARVYGMSASEIFEGVDSE